jgi:hypothetical protein
MQTFNCLATFIMHDSLFNFRNVFFETPCIFGTYFEMFLYPRQQPLNQKSQVSIYYITFFSLFLYYTLSNPFLNFDICSVYIHIYIYIYKQVIFR